LAGLTAVFRGEFSERWEVDVRGPLKSEQVCRLAELWIQVFDRTADIIAAPGLPPTDVLIVGDLAPPFWSHEGRSHFVPAEVPWIRLRSRAGS